jgi:hypothetical protein
MHEREIGLIWRFSKTIERRRESEVRRVMDGRRPGIGAADAIKMLEQKRIWLANKSWGKQITSRRYRTPDLHRDAQLRRSTAVTTRQ